MRYVYAHFPINVNLEKNAETGNYEVEIRYVPMDGTPRASWEILGNRGREGWGCGLLPETGSDVKFTYREADCWMCGTATSSVRRSSGGS